MALCSRHKGVTMSVQECFSHVPRHIAGEVSAICSVQPPNGGGGSPLIRILNSFLPFIRLKETNFHYLALTRDALVHIAVDHDGTVYSKREYPRAAISNVAVTAREHQVGVSFSHNGERVELTCLEYPFGASGLSETDYAEAKQLTHTIVRAIAN